MSLKVLLRKELHMHLFKHIVDVWGVDHVMFPYSLTLLAAQEKEVFFLGRFSWLYRSLRSGEGEGRSCQWWKWVWESLKWMKAGCIKCSKNAVTNTNKILPSHTHTPVLCSSPPIPNLHPHAPPSKALHPLPHIPHLQSHIPLSISPTLMLMLTLPMSPTPIPMCHFFAKFTWLSLTFPLTFPNFVILSGKSHVHCSQSHLFLYFSLSSCWLLLTQKFDFPWPVQNLWLHLTFIWVFLTNVLFFLLSLTFLFTEDDGTSWARSESLDDPAAKIRSVSAGHIAWAPNT